MKHQFKIQNVKFKLQTEVRKMQVTAALILTFAFCIMQFAFVGTAQAMLTAKANHDHITIDFFYHGSTVSVRGISDPGVDLVVKITSPKGTRY